MKMHKLLLISPVVCDQDFHFSWVAIQDFCVLQFDYLFR